MADVFISHSRRDESQRDWFLSFFGHSGVRPICKEFDEYRTPPWADIKSDLHRSKALFLLLTPSVLSSIHTVNWVSFEVTTALVYQKPLWIFEEIEHLTPFPIPSVHQDLTHYVPYSRSWTGFDRYVRQIIRGYEDVEGQSLLALGAAGAAVGAMLSGDRWTGAALGALLIAAFRYLAASHRQPCGRRVRCPHANCGVQFLLHATIDDCPCPSCRQNVSVSSRSLTTVLRHDRESCR